MKEADSYRILYAEDDLDGLELVKQAFKKYPNIEIIHANNGFEALSYLDSLPDGMAPCLIILDINMPGLDGKQTLVKLKQTDKFSKLPVVMFTTSNNELDKKFAVKWGAEFITKPLKYEEIKNLAEEFSRKCKINFSHNA